MKPMQRSLLAAAIVAALSASAYALPVRAKDTQTGTTQKQDKKKPQELKKIIVTGSLIPTAEINTATPTITITAQDIKRQGFTTLYQALRAQPLATGEVQGNNLSAGFTQGAQTISLLGLSPDFTLILINGHPLASYPLLYNGESNISNISNIPLAMVSRVDIVPGNQSSIYGSAAIAGVVNIILKHHAEGTTFNYQAGGYSQGGGTSQKVSLVGGFSTNRFNMVYGLTYLQRQPIYQFQRSYAASTFDSPNPQLATEQSVTYGIFDYGPLFQGNSYVDPNNFGANPCANIAAQYGGTTGRGATLTPVRGQPGQYVSNGYACGSPYAPGYNTVSNKVKEGSAYLNGSFRINRDAELYGNLLLDIYSQNYGVGPFYSFWEPNISAAAVGQSPGIIFNSISGTFQNPFELFAPEEVGGLLTNSTHEVDRSYNFYGGIKGSIGNGDWNYNAYYARSQQNTSTTELHPITSKVNAFFQNQFLGQQQGTNYGYPVYAPNYANFYKSVTPAEYRSFSALVGNSSEDYTQNINLNITNTDLFRLPTGNVGFAGIVQAGDEQWTLPVNPAIAAGQVWGQTASAGGGRRNNYAAAVEFHIPITRMLSSDISARYDRFHNDGASTASRPTYKISLAFRPFSTLLLRANYSTAFRMPDMGYVFLGPSGNYQFITDYYQCEKRYPGTPLGQCSQVQDGNVNYQITGTQLPNPNLQPTTAKSWGGGVVWSPTSNFDIKADYYDIRISNEVQYESVNSLILENSECLLGTLPANSTVCVLASNAVTRSLRGGITNVAYSPINIAKERVSGIVASLDYRYNAGKYGQFTLNGSYNVTLHHTLQPFQAATYNTTGTATYHLLHNPYYDYLYSQGGSALGPEYKSILSGTLTWSIGNWTSALTGIRYGKLPNFAAYANPTVYQSYGAGRLAPWIIYNGTVKYDISRAANISLTVNNLFDAMPPKDNSYTGWPYYDQGAYNIFGRSYYVDFNYRF